MNPTNYSYIILIQLKAIIGNVPLLPGSLTKLAENCFFLHPNNPNFYWKQLPIAWPQHYQIQCYLVITGTFCMHIYIQCYGAEAGFSLVEPEPNFEGVSGSPRRRLNNWKKTSQPSKPQSNSLFKSFPFPLQYLTSLGWRKLTVLRLILRCETNLQTKF